MTDPVIQPGSRYQGLLIQQLLGESDLGALYAAEAPEHGQVFLRVLSRARIEDASELDLVERDLARLQGVVHRNVARVLGGEDREGELHYVLEALGKSTLLDLARSCRPFNERELIWLARGVSAGLAALHAAGLFHGGLLPGAVVVTRHGPIVVDLGWRNRVGSGERPAPERAAQLDLESLHELLQFALSPTGRGKPCSPKVQTLLDRLLPTSSEPLASAAAAAEAFREHAQHMGLPDPMAPTSLQRMLDQHEGVDPLEASQEGDPLERESPPLHRSSGSRDRPLDPGESQDLDASFADRPLPPRPADSDDLDSSSDSGPIPLIQPPGGPADSDESAVYRSAAIRKNTMAHARAMLDEFPADPPSVEGAGLPPRPSASAGSAESGRSERGLAPGLGPFGDYTLVSELAADSTSTLFEAQHPESARPIVVRVFLPGLLAQEAATKRFQRRAQAGEALQHRRLARVLDSGFVDEWAFLASARVGGRSLPELIAAHPRARARAPQVLADVLRGLEHAHGMGVVHGALTPNAVRVDEEGQGRVVDFGQPVVRDAAVIRGRDPRRDYAPPEFAEGQLDEGCDVYAVGVILYEALTGTLPSKAKGGILTGSPPPPSVLAPAVPPSLDAIVLTAISTAPGDRYPSAGALADDLEHFVARPKHARALKPGQRVGRWISHRGVIPSLVGLVVAACLAVLAGVGAATVLGLGGTSAKVGAKPVPSARPSASPSNAGTGSEAGGSEALRRELAATRERLLKHRAARKDQDAELERVGVALTKAEREVERAKGELGNERSDEVRRLVELGAELLSGGKPTLAERVYRRALGLAPNHAGAREGSVRAREAQTKDSLPPAEVEQREEGERRLAEGRANLASGRFADARSKLLQAHALGAPEARALLDKAQAGLLRERVETHADEQRAERASQAKRMLATADAEKNLGKAEATYLEVLALDPKSEGARAGLARVIAKRAKRATPKPGPDTQPNLRRREQALDAGERRTTEARRLYTEARDLDKAIDTYFAALHHLSRADAFDPRMPTAGAATQRAVQELAAILREDGQATFANSLLRFYGLDPQAASALEAPSDPHLVVEEAERTSIRRAFGGVVRFQPTRAFDPLRKWVRAQGDRFRVRLQVKSRVQPGFPPKVFASGVWVRIEDRERKTLSAPSRVEFEGGPYPRIVVVDSRGRLVRPFTRASTLKAQPYVDEVTALAKSLLEAAKKR